MRIRARYRHDYAGWETSEIEAMLTEAINAQILAKIEGRYQGTLPNGYLFDVTLDEVTLENDITFTDLTIK